MARIVFVPKAPPPAQDLIAQVNPPPAFDRDGNPAIMPPFAVTVPVARVGLHDPFVEASNWYGCKMSDRIREDDIQFKFFDREDLSYWMETNLDGVILVQATDHREWTLGFTKIDSFYRFRRWWDSVTHIGTIPPFDVTEATYNEIRIWINENVRGRHKLERSYAWTDRGVKINAAFEDPDEAVAFKMVWYDPTKVR